MTTKSIYFSIEMDEKKELEMTAKNLGIKPSELARRRYRQGKLMQSSSGLSDGLLEYLVKLSTFQYAALEKIINQRPDNFESVMIRGAELYSEALRLVESSKNMES